ncbi:MAG TPA: di-heme-cytochrome C peroxidase, partial [Allosphingosinicella sp.]|nr:di-heme-cytochrome C peroxidase [Allosphingosinicella sp.]
MRGTARYTLMVSASVALMASAQALYGQGPAPASASQGWTANDQSFWYWTTQGSRLIPESWFRALERAEDEVRFMAPENINRYRYLTSGMSNGLPVGFAVDQQDDDHLERTRLRWRAGQPDNEPWIGFTCAACHTSEIAVGTRRLRIDGAPGMGDFQRLVEDVDRALHALQTSATATGAGQSKWRRFSAAVLGRRDNDANRATLLRALGEHIARRDQVATMNRTPIRYGFSRVDAIGYIYNQASLFSRATPPTANAPTAPVSYPFLWNVPQHDRVQWNGSVDRDRKKVLGHSLDIGAMGRNTGEVIGVFGEVRTDDRGLLGYRSSVHPLRLARLEVMLQRLQPPSWRQENVAPIDEAAAARGQRIFERACTGCHAPLDRDDLGTNIIADLSYFGQNAPDRKPIGTNIPQMPNIPPGTDPLMACNAFFRTANTGNLAGSRFGQGPLGPNASVL